MFSLVAPRVPTRLRAASISCAALSDYVHGQVLPVSGGLLGGMLT